MVRIDNVGTESRSAPCNDQIPSGSGDQLEVSLAAKMVGDVSCFMVGETIKEIDSGCDSRLSALARMYALEDSSLLSVIPAEAGIQVFRMGLDPGFHRGDENAER